MGLEKRRRAKISDWLCEASVLLMILPIVDQLFSPTVVAAWKLCLCVLLALLCLMLGLYMLERS
jgi:Flp pilus assembly protein protease CpaA